jgi:DNA polymerase-3 subunit epsilon
MSQWWRRERSRFLATPFSCVGFLVVDIETTGLDPRRDHVLEVGWVPVLRGEVVLDGVRGTLVRTPVGVGESAVLHGLTDDELAAAPGLTDVLPELKGALQGRVLVAHHAPIEIGFLGDALREAAAAEQADRQAERASLHVVDTMTLQRRLLVGGHGEPPPGALRLDAARRGYGLPRYAAHRAATDAIATAELLLAQVAELGNRLGHEPTLADLSPQRMRW